MKALFCGLGSIGQRHLRNLRQLAGNEVEVLAYRSRRAGFVLNPDMTVRTGADLEKTFNLRSFSDLEKALSEKPDVVFVTNPNACHLEVALAAAGAGCHLFIEKPISDEMAGVDELISLVKAKKLVALVGYQFRFHPGLRLIKSLLDARRAGQLASAHIVNGEYIPDWHPYEDYRKTHAAQREMGGGCLRIQTHEFDYAIWLFGMPKRLFAVGGHLSRLQLDVEDSVSVLMECHDEARAFPVHIHLDYLQKPAQRFCEIIGDAGRVCYDYYANHVQFQDRESGLSEVTRFDQFDRNRMFLDEMSHFLACLRGETTPMVDLEEGRRSLELALASADSMARGETVVVSGNGKN